VTDILDVVLLSLSVVSDTANAMTLEEIRNERLARQ